MNNGGDGGFLKAIVLSRNLNKSFLFNFILRMLYVYTPSQKFDTIKIPELAI